MDVYPSPLTALYEPATLSVTVPPVSTLSLVFSVLLLDFFFVQNISSLSVRFSPPSSLRIHKEKKDERFLSGWWIQLGSHLVWMMDNGERKVIYKSQNFFAAPTETFNTDLLELAVRVWRSSLEAELETVEGLMKHGGRLTVPRRSLFGCLTFTPAAPLSA